MSNQMLIQAGQAALGSGASSRSGTSAQPSVAPAAPAAKPVPLFVNPSFEFDPTVGIVVIDFHNETGAVTNSIPSQRQLEAYRNHQETPLGEQGPPIPKASAPVYGKTATG